MKHPVRKFLSFALALSMLCLPVAGYAEYWELTSWKMIDGVWQYEDVDGTLYPYDPTGMTLPPDADGMVYPAPQTKPAPNPEPAYEPEPEPEYVEPEPEYVEPEPEYVEPEPEYVEPESEYVEPAPEYVEPAPEYVEPEPEYVEPEPEYVEPEPDYVEPEPEIIEPEIVEPEPEIPEQPETVEPVINPEDLEVNITPIFAGEKPQYGEAVRLLSVVLGAPEGAALNYQWQYLPQGGSWTDVPGANGSTYEFVLDESNVYYTWRLLVTPVNEAA